MKNVKVAGKLDPAGKQKFDQLMRQFSAIAQVSFVLTWIVRGNEYHAFGVTDRGWNSFLCFIILKKNRCKLYFKPIHQSILLVIYAYRNR